MFQFHGGGGWGSSRTSSPPRVAGPLNNPKAPSVKPPAGSWDTHAHIFGPHNKFPYAVGRGYTPPDAPVENYLTLLNRLGCEHAVVVQGNAHGCDNRALLDALERYPNRLRGIAVTDARFDPMMLREWDAIGVRGLRFHILRQSDSSMAGLDAFAAFRRTMAELGFVAQFFCEYRMLALAAEWLRAVAREMPVILDHYGTVETQRGIEHENFQALLRLLGEGHVYVKLSAAYRISRQYPDYTDVRAFHDALLRLNPQRLIWGTDWPHPTTQADVMPDDGHLLDLFQAWTPDPEARRCILVETPARLFGR